MGLVRRGRPPGSANRRSLVILTRLSEEGYDVVQEIVRCLSEINDPVIRLQANIRLLEFCAPRLKAIEVCEVGMETTPITDSNVKELYSRAHEAAMEAAKRRHKID